MGIEERWARLMRPNTTQHAAGASRERGERDGTKTLEHDEARFRTLADAAFDGIGISQDGKIVETNDQLAALLGYERSELVGKEVMRLVAPESRERVAHAIRAGLSDPYEHWALRKDGSLLRVEVRGKLIQLGGRSARVTVVRDISQRRRVEDAVKAIVEGTSVVGVEFFAALVRGVASALGVRDAMVGELVTPRGEPASGSGAVRLRTLALWADGQLWDNVEFDLPGTSAAAVLADGLSFYPSGIRERFPSDDLLERLRAEAYLGVSLSGASGKPLGVLAAMHDGEMDRSELGKSIFGIFAGRAAAELERVRTDAALRRSEASLRATIDGARHVAVQWFDRDGRVLLWNRASEEMFGYSADEARGKTLDQLISSPEDAREFRERIVAILDGVSPPCPSEYRFRRRDGQWGDCLSTCFRISDGDGCPRVACMDVDITERRRAERRKAELETRLRHTQQLEALGTFAGGIAHDFNNILTAIFAYCELVSAEAEEPEAIRDYVSEIHRAASRARDLVQQILVFSRRQTQTRKPLLLQDVVRDALKFVRSTLPSTIEIESSIDARAPAVLASSIQMYQVILNLCMNAAQAMTGGPGTLRVTFERLRADVETEPPASELGVGEYVRLSVSDTGHGMDSETVQHIFEPFFTTKSPGEGTGLGLAMVYGIVQDHQGAVRVTSEPGEGTTFTVYLPVRGASEVDGQDGRAPAALGHGERVMLVDDEAPLCEASRSLLVRQGYRVVAYMHPQQALEAFERAPQDVDIAIIDVTLPHMRGTELARRMLARRPDLPVILISGLAAGVGPSDLDDLGVRAFFPKPFDPPELAAAVRRTLDDPA